VSSPSTDPHTNQFALLTQRRFAPFFWTQFLGAGNDNLFKFAFTLMVTYQLQLEWLPSGQAGLVIGGLFILPFLLFSATSGQLADTLDKARLMQFIKSFEVVVMAVAAYGFVAAQVPVLLACIFLMGLHSALFGPVKYAYMPQHLNERELTGGNGMIEMGTFVAILLGNVVGGLLINLPEGGAAWTAGVCLALAVAGRVVAQFLPASPPMEAGGPIRWNPVTETWASLKLAHGNLAVFRSLLGISWMWAVGAVFLSQFPAFARMALGGGPNVALVLLMTFSVGIGTGSLLCEVLSRRHVEIGLVPLGAIGMTVFAGDLYLACRGLPLGHELTAMQFLAQAAHWRVLADLFFLALSAGLFSVPMYALIQLRATPSHRARIIAANNILNAVFMILSSVITGALLSFGLSIPDVFLVIAALNAIVAIYIFSLVPEYFMRFVAWVVSRLVYRFRVVGDEHIPAEGAAIIAANHVSFIDPVLLMAASPRPIRFMMDHRIFALPALGAFFRLCKAIPVAPQKEDPVIYEQAFRQARQVLEEGELLGIFPEGGITRDGQLQEFRGGIMKVLQDRPVPVVPVALQNLWGSFFSRIEGSAMSRPFRRGLFSRVGVVAAAAMPAAEMSPHALRERVGRMLRG
jgi:1-acyl-sn-glycerol-3-phosphate acyltransferase